MARLRDMFKNPGPSYGAELMYGRQGNRPVKGVKTGTGRPLMQRFGTGDPATAPSPSATYPVGGSPEAQLSSRLRARPRAADVDVQPFNPEEIVGEDLGEDVATGSGSPLRTGTGGRVARGVSGQDHPVIELGGISIEQEFTGTPENPKWGNVTVKDLEFVNALRRFAGKQPLGEMNMEAVPAFGGHVPPSYGRK